MNLSSGLIPRTMDRMPVDNGLPSRADTATRLAVIIK